MVRGWEWCRKRYWKVKSMKIIEDLYQGAQTFSCKQGGASPEKSLSREVNSQIVF